MVSGQYAYPLKIVAFNVIEGWCRDAIEEIADALANRAASDWLDLSPALEAFVQANSSRPFGLRGKRYSTRRSPCDDRLSFARCKTRADATADRSSSSGLAQRYRYFTEKQRAVGSAPASLNGAPVHVGSPNH